MFGSCEEEKYVNEETNKTFVDSDVCDPLIFRFGKQEMFKKKIFFRRRTTCPGAKCEVDKQPRTNHLLNFFLIFNALGLILLLRFVQVNSFLCSHFMHVPVCR